MRAAMRSPLDSEAVERLAALVANDGTLAVAVAAGCSPTTVRAALRGATLNGPTLRVLRGLLPVEGAPAHRLAA